MKKPSKAHWHCWEKFKRFGTDIRDTLFGDCGHHTQIRIDDGESRFQLDMERCHICFKERQYDPKNPVRKRKASRLCLQQDEGEWDD